MLQFADSDIEKILAGTREESTDSNLGFFSKPFRLEYEGQDLIVKTYTPQRNKSLVNSIINNHEEYVKAMRAIGIRIPETFITIRENRNRFQIIIIQKAFAKDQLYRPMLEEGDKDQVLHLCKLIFDETVHFWKNRPTEKIGFHPTSRNYALVNEEMHYFDTFPPMLMDQPALNDWIIKMSPFGNVIKPFVPNRLINQVSDEYYDIVKMFMGIVGSACRLRPELAVDILEYARNYIKGAGIKKEEIAAILAVLNKPPGLSRIWTTVRKLSGNVGRPNIKDQKPD